MSFDWPFFLLLSSGITVIRIIMLRMLPFEWISVDSAVWLGFIIFLALPAGFMPDSLGVDRQYYSIQVWVGYLSFSVASALMHWRGYHLSKLRLLSQPVRVGLLKVALWYCLIYVGAHLVSFFASGGLGAVMDIWLHGDPMRDYLRETVGSWLLRPPSADPLAVLSRTLNVFFLAFWGLLFRKRPVLSTAIWCLYALTFLSRYWGREAIVIHALMPWACYLLVYRPPGKHVLLQSLIAMGILIIYMTVASLLRIGDIDRISDFGLADVVEELRASTSSVVYGTWILNSSLLRGSWADYLVAFLSYPIPRVIWAGKPLISFNLLMTYLMTGRGVGPDNAIMTFTMFGEGWYYFGQLGAIIIMFLFGFSAKLFERLFSSNDLFLAPYVYLTMVSLFEIRSTFLGFYSYGLSTFLTILALLIVIKSSMTILQKGYHPTSPRQDLLAQDAS